MRSVLVLAALLAGCIDHGRFPTLGRPEQDRFMRCRQIVAGNTCYDEMTRNRCTSIFEREYAEQPDEASRRDWLVARGCPKNLIDG